MTRQSNTNFFYFFEFWTFFFCQTLWEVKWKLKKGRPEMRNLIKSKTSNKLREFGDPIPLNHFVFYSSIYIEIMNSETNFNNNNSPSNKVKKKKTNKSIASQRTLQALTIKATIRYDICECVCVSICVWVLEILYDHLFYLATCLISVNVFTNTMASIKVAKKKNKTQKTKQKF